MSGTTEDLNQTNEPQSTFEKEMENPAFKAEFEKEYEKDLKVEELTEEEIKAKITELQEEENAKRLLKIEEVRALHPSKVLNRAQLEALMSIKEEELTDADKSRVQLATLRLKHHRYTGTGYSATERKRVKAARRTAKKSRKINR